MATTSFELVIAQLQALYEQSVRLRRQGSTLRVCALVVRQQSAVLRQKMVRHRWFLVLTQCAWCGIALEWTWIATPPAAPTSHGICLRCYEQVLGEPYQELPQEPS